MGSLYEGDQIEDIPAPHPLVEGLLDYDSIAQWYGPSGHGKSAIVHSVALSIAMGVPWYGHRVHRGRVLYVAAEGASGYGARHMAWKAHHRISHVSGIDYLTVAPNLTEKEDLDAILRVVEERQPQFTVLDTLARHIPGGDDSTGPTMSIMVEALDAIKRITGGCASTVHHTGLATTDRSRGHTSLLGALDHSIRIVRGQNRIIDVYAAKNKNHRDGYSVIKMQLHEIADSIVAIEDDSLTPNERLCLEVLGICPVSGGIETQLEGPAWIQSHTWEAASLAKGISHASHFRYVDKLVALGFVEKNGPQYQVSRGE